MLIPLKVLVKFAFNLRLGLMLLNIFYYFQVGPAVKCQRTPTCSRFVLARLFWNQILTCTSVIFNSPENSARSEMDKYCFSLYFFSSAFSCCVVNGVLGFLFGLCFLRVQRMGPMGGCRVISEQGENRL